MRRLLNLLMCCCVSLTTFAQVYSGKVTDEKSQPLPYTNVVLLSLPDSAFVTGTVSDESGAFTLRSEKPNLLLRISSIGYATIYNKVDKPDLGTIQLLPDAQLLGEVVVKGDLPKVQLKGDAQVTNVTGTILEKAGTGNDLLSKLPGVSAEEGTVNVFGSGTAEIYINGRKMRNASELDQLSSDNVKRVEVVRNPGARYDATVKAVVRIYTKKAQGEGFGFNNRFLTRYYYGWNVLDQFNFNYRKGGFDLSGMLFGSKTEGEDNKTGVFETFLDNTWRQESSISTTGGSRISPLCSHSITSSTRIIQPVRVTTSTVRSRTGGISICTRKCSGTVRFMKRTPAGAGRGLRLLPTPLMLITTVRQATGTLTSMPTACGHTARRCRI
ncbi:carboxypeptidase-like regulatory domain-containing protein [Bacteroides gallinaceum]|uniref:carboxypeptidase-like regulatory domain-containing protein n=1 Tax=Bacteroides gallinaceum TaxID=1462571 RepID=UPI001EF49457|nr:carboxypeptidase-like regulatory domain-containing protein [Bacteroides gallinaceum]